MHLYWTSIATWYPTPLGAIVVPSLFFPRSFEHAFVVFPSTFRITYIHRVYIRVNLGRGKLGGCQPR